MANRLTPFDAETCVMLESLTGREVYTTEKDRKTFTVETFYSEHHDPDYINAIINAVKGRYGKRFVDVEDLPDGEMLMFTIEYDTTDYPDVEGTFDNEPAQHDGKVYCRHLEEIRAIQVQRGHHEELVAFVGNGQLYTERKPNGKCWFTFLNNGVFVNVPENNYIVEREGATHFEIWPETKFKQEWEPKN